MVGGSGGRERPKEVERSLCAISACLIHMRMKDGNSLVIIGSPGS